MTFLPVSQVVRTQKGRKDVFGGGREGGGDPSRRRIWPNTRNINQCPPPTELQLAICKYELLTLNRKENAWF